MLRLIRLWPLLILTLAFFTSAIFFLGEGPTWPELENLYLECRTEWWTVIFFLNDVIPFYVKDLNSCMRFTAVYSIEMKLFLLLPVLTLLYHKGHKLIVIIVCILLISLCFLITVRLF